MIKKLLFYVGYALVFYASYILIVVAMGFLANVLSFAAMMIIAIIIFS